MRRTLTLTVDTLRDLAAISAWLRQPGAGRTAAERLAGIRTTIRDLKSEPVRWPSGDEAGTREAPSRGFRIIDFVDPDTGSNRSSGDVTVLRVFGPGQDRTVSGSDMSNGPKP